MLATGHVLYSPTYSATTVVEEVCIYIYVRYDSCRQVLNQQSRLQVLTQAEHTDEEVIKNNKVVLPLPFCLIFCACSACIS